MSGVSDEDPSRESKASIAGGIALSLVVLVIVAGLAAYLTGWRWSDNGVDVPKLEQTLEERYGDEGYPADIDCPDSMQAERGTTNDCIATFDDDTTARVEIRWQNDDGEYVATIAQ